MVTENFLALLQITYIARKNKPYFFLNNKTAWIFERVIKNRPSPTEFASSIQFPRPGNLYKNYTLSEIEKSDRNRLDCSLYTIQYNRNIDI
jgi:hypothetical protein